jgi:hypothetical protein
VNTVRYPVSSTGPPSRATAWSSQAMRPC